MREIVMSLGPAKPIVANMECCQMLPMREERQCKPKKKNTEGGKSIHLRKLAFCQPLKFLGLGVTESRTRKTSQKNQIKRAVTLVPGLPAD